MFQMYIGTNVLDPNNPVLFTTKVCDYILPTVYGRKVRLGILIWQFGRV